MVCSRPNSFIHEALGLAKHLGIWMLELVDRLIDCPPREPVVSRHAVLRSNVLPIADLNRAPNEGREKQIGYAAFRSYETTQNPSTSHN
jgi:hypothetical protein